MSLESMYSLDITLKEFVSQIPSCLQEDSLEKILDAAKSGHSEIIAIVNHQKFPLGIVNCHSLLCLLTKYCHNQVEVSVSHNRSLVDETVIFSPQELKSLVQPVITLNSQITIKEFLPYLQNSSLPRNKNQIYLIINSQGELLGILDLAKLLHHLLSNSQTELDIPVRPLSIERQVLSFLEAIALPLKLQTADGQVLYCNSYWQKLIGKTLLETKPIAQWWLKQQERSKTNEFFDLLQPPASNCYCLKNNHHLTTLFAVKSHSDSNCQLIQNENYLVNLSLEQKHSKYPNSNIDSIQPLSRPDSNWDYFQIPLNLASTDITATNSPASHWLILGTASQETQRNPDNSQDAELIQLNRLKDELLANISHELKSPLTGIVGLSSLLKEEKLGQLNQRQQRYAELIYRSGRKLISIISDLLDLSSLATGKLKLKLEPIELDPF